MTIILVVAFGLCISGILHYLIDLIRGGIKEDRKMKKEIEQLKKDYRKARSPIITLEDW